MLSTGRSAWQWGHEFRLLSTRLLQWRHNHPVLLLLLMVLDYLCDASLWSMSHPAQLPEHMLSESQSLRPISSRVSCTAHLMPIFCILGFVDISDWMWCPLRMYVSDIANAKNPTTTTAAMIVTNSVDIILAIFNSKIVKRCCSFRCKFIYLQLNLQMLQFVVR